MKEENKNNMAVIKKSTFQADKISTKNKLLADENEKYAHYLNCVITAMNNSMSIKVTFAMNKLTGCLGIPEIHIKLLFTRQKPKLKSLIWSQKWEIANIKWKDCHKSLRFGNIMLMKI